MQTAKELKTFERKNASVILQTTGSQYVITTSQRIRMDLVWVTESVRATIDEALQEFTKHKLCIMSNRHCIGDKSHLR